MILKSEIFDLAAEWRLSADIVEKDYVLGWLLAGFGTAAQTSDCWVFKGGTCLKKCYFETYRFSEDLDFTLMEDAEYDVGGIESAVQAVAIWTDHESGIDIPLDSIQIRPRKNKAGQLTFEGRIYYRGPLGRRDLSRIRLDLTRHERLVNTPVRRGIYHSYSDALSSDSILTYQFEELIAEKVRALIDRARPRDLYDVICIFRTQSEGINFQRVLSILREKCAFKGIAIPRLQEWLEGPQRAELGADWDNMLKHQLPALPPFEDYWSILSDCLAWIEERPVVVTRFTHIPLGGGESPYLMPRRIMAWRIPISIETIRFAGINRLLVRLTYNSKIRTVEPYSFRQSREGNILFYGWKYEDDHIKCYRVDRIQSVEAIPQTFTPRYAVEF
jgi:predicted nucleotidyltransferase component of viral defense system